jgi:hypothetical protein
LYSLKHKGIKEYGGVEIELHIYLFPAPDNTEEPELTAPASFGL